MKMNDRERDNGNIFQEVVSKFSEMIGENTEKSIIQYDELPQYDLFLSQVKDYLNDKFKHDKFTNSILQNYIKSEVISKPEDGKKRGYTKLHLAQLVLLGYMRPILTTDEIKSVFRYRNIYPAAIGAISDGKIDVNGIVTHEFDFSDTKEAFDYVIENKNDVVKAVIKL